MNVTKKPVISAYQLGSILLTFITLMFIPGFTHLENTQKVLREAAASKLTEQFAVLKLSLHISEASFLCLAAAAAIILFIVISLYFYSAEPISLIRLLLTVTAILTAAAVILFIVSCLMNSRAAIMLAEAV